MRKIIILIIITSFTSCYFGANESGGKIIKNFYLIGWDEKDWQIVHSLNNEIYEPEKIIIQHDVFAVGHNKDFIIAKQHPCQDSELHIIDFDSLKVNKSITNYYIIEIHKNSYQLHNYVNLNEFKKGKLKLGVPENLDYKFYDKTLE